jgi:hypothetical protein
MLKKGPFVVKSFVIVGSFDYDYTLKEKHKIKEKF